MAWSIVGTKDEDRLKEVLQQKIKEDPPAIPAPPERPDKSFRYPVRPPE